MAIDLYFYSTNPQKLTQDLLQQVSSKHPEFFSAKYLISDADEADEVEKEIALDYGLTAHSSFMIHLNDKEAAALIADVVKVIKAAFGSGNIIAMFGGSEFPI